MRRDTDPTQCLADGGVGHTGPARARLNIVLSVVLGPTTAAWNAVNPVDPTQDEWRLVERAVGIEHGWNAAYQLVSTLEPPGQGRAPT